MACWRHPRAEYYLYKKSTRARARVRERGQRNLLLGLPLLGGRGGVALGLAHRPHGVWRVAVRLVAAPQAPRGGRHERLSPLLRPSAAECWASSGSAAMPRCRRLLG